MKIVCPQAETEEQTLARLRKALIHLSDQASEWSFKIATHGARSPRRWYRRLSQIRQTMDEFWRAEQALAIRLLKLNRR